MQMPVMDGLEATRQIRVKEKTNNEPRVPIIALTASTTPEDKVQCTQAGMDDWYSTAIPVSVVTRHHSVQPQAI
jgi:CheY-like chemotaxis protein